MGPDGGGGHCTAQCGRLMCCGETGAPFHPPTHPSTHPPTAGREVVRQLTNCEDLLLNFVTAAAIRDQGKQQISTSAARTTAGAQQDSSAAAAGHADGAAADPPALPGAGVLRWPPHVLWTQPGRRLDISVLSGVGISRGTAVHGGEPGLLASGRL